MAHDESSGPVLAQAGQGGLLLVDGSHLPPLRSEALGDRRPHPAAADNNELHEPRVAPGSTSCARRLLLEHALPRRRLRCRLEAVRALLARPVNTRCVIAPPRPLRARPAAASLAMPLGGRACSARTAG